MHDLNFHLIMATVKPLIQKLVELCQVNTTSQYRHFQIHKLSTSQPGFPEELPSMSISLHPAEDLTMKPNKFSNEQLGSHPSFATKEKKNILWFLWVNLVALHDKHFDP